MKNRSLVSIFLVLLILFTVVSCKSKNQGSTVEEKGASAIAKKVSGSASKVAGEFLDAGMKGDFKRIAELCCKNDGPYTSFDDVKRLDLSDVGFIEQIVREEDSEADPANLKIVVVRAKVLGEIGFKCFLLNRTPAGIKVYIHGDYLWPYPQERLSQTRRLLDFYFSNKINYKESIILTKYLIDANNMDMDAHYKLATIYLSNNQRKEAISEIKRMVEINNESQTINLFSKDNLLAATEELLAASDDASKRMAYNLLSRMTVDSSTIPMLEQILNTNDNAVKEAVARMLSDAGNPKGRDAIIEILVGRLNTYNVYNWRENRSYDVDSKMERIIRELGNFKDARAAGPIVDSVLLGPAGGIPSAARNALLKIGSMAIPALESAVKRESEYRERWKEWGPSQSGGADWRYDHYQYGIKTLLNKIKGQ